MPSNHEVTNSCTLSQIACHQTIWTDINRNEYKSNELCAFTVMRLDLRREKQGSKRNLYYKMLLKFIHNSIQLMHPIAFNKLQIKMLVRTHFTLPQMGQTLLIALQCEFIFKLQRQITLRDQYYFIINLNISDLLPFNVLTINVQSFWYLARLSIY